MIFIEFHDLALSIDDLNFDLGCVSGKMSIDNVCHRLDKYTEYFFLMFCITSLQP